NDGNNAPFFTKIVAWDGPGSNNLGNEVFTFSFTKVYRSTNFADSWAALPVVPVETNGELRNVAVAATDDKVIGAVGSGCRVYLTVDTGAHWTVAATGTNNETTALPGCKGGLSYIHFDPGDRNRVYVASVFPSATATHLWRSTDFGAHWAAIDGNGMPVGVPVDVIKSDPLPNAGQVGMVLYAGTHFGVYRTADGGATWARFGSGMPLVEVADLYVSPDESIVRAASYGRGFWELNHPTKDFLINADPFALSIEQGASGTSTISTSIVSGGSQTIDLTVTGAPSGTTATLNPTSVVVGNSSTLTLSVGNATAPG